jgi:hypothetical protein
VRYCFKKPPRKHYKHFTVIDKKLNLFRDLKQPGINDPAPDPGDSKTQCPESFGRVPLARALVHDPRILFLDEPATGLAPQFNFRFLLPYILFIFLGCILFSCLGSLAGTLIDKPENLGRLEAVAVMPFIFLAGLFFPLSAYPDIVLPYIQALPTTALFDGARLALLTGKVGPLCLANLSASAGISFFPAVGFF